LAALLSAVFPGAGQWYGGRRRTAAALALGVGIGLAGIVWLALLGPRRLIEIFVQPRWLWALFAANLVLLAGRVFAVADAYRGERARGGSGRPWVRWAALGLLLAVTVAPHAIVADYSLEAIDTIETVFDDDPLPPVEQRIAAALEAGADPADLGPVLSTTTTTGAPPTPPPPATTTTIDPDAVPGIVAVKELIPYEDRFPFRPEITPREGDAFAPLPEGEGFAGESRITILLAGGDAGPQRWSLRTDVMIVATLDLQTNKAALIGVSRDMVQIPLPAAFENAFVDWELRLLEDARAKEAATTTTTTAGEEGASTTTTTEPFVPCRCFPDRLNGLYTFTLNWFNTFPDARDPGMEALRRTLSELLGLPIDYSVLVDMAGFVDLVDALGGIDVTVTEAMDVAYSPAREGEEPVSITVEPGRHHLDGHQALAYVRDRSTSNDGARMRRQRCTLRALAAEMTPLTLVTRFSQIAGAIRESTTTDIPLNFVPDLISAAASLTAADIQTLAIGAPAHTTGSDYRGLPIVDAEKVRSRVAGVLWDLQQPEASFDEGSECG
jgi:LCP family protein required for cell wall assembly